MPRTPQFASTPRFLLSQRGPPPSSSLSATRPSRPETIDEDDSPQNTPLAKRARGRHFATTPAPTTRQLGTQRIAIARDVIEDSEDEESGLSGAEVDSELEAEYEALFGESERSAAKRRRVEVEEKGEGNGDEEDNNNDANDHDHGGQTDGSTNANVNGAGNDAPEHEHNHNPQNHHEDAYSDENIPFSPLKPPSTPLPNPLRPRFLLSASSQLPTPSQTHSQFYPPSSTKKQKQIDVNPPQSMTPAAPTSTFPDPTIAPPSTSSSRRKPGFVLPRSPSPDTALEDFPSLFSPSRTQRRRGRQRGSGQGYVAGGMAEQVRGWVLEMGVKGSHHSGSGNGLGGLDAQNYAFIVRVEKVERSVMGSCGDLVFVRGLDFKDSGGEGCEEDRNGGTDDEVMRNVLLMGAPRSWSLNSETVEKGEIPDLKPGDLVGVGWGLVWDVDLDAMGESASGEMEKWSVCMEWDVL